MTDRELIDRWIAEHGVTRCPPAVAYGVEMPGFQLPTAASDALAARGDDPAGNSYRARAQHGWTAYWAARRRREARTVSKGTPVVGSGVGT